MRICIPILAFVLGISSLAAEDKGEFIRVQSDSFVGYIIPSDQAPKLGTQVTGYWTPSSDEAVAADAAFKVFLDRAKLDPAIAFPELKSTSDKNAALIRQKYLDFIERDFSKHARQFVGIVVQGKKVIFCHYAPSGNVAASARMFVCLPADFWEIHYDPIAKRCFDFTYCDE